MLLPSEPPGKPNKPMDFHDAFMDIKGFTDPRLETVCLFICSVCARQAAAGRVLGGG